jgi:hypothetical protein
VVIIPIDAVLLYVSASLAGSSAYPSPILKRLPVFPIPSSTDELAHHTIR